MSQKAYIVKPYYNRKKSKGFWTPEARRYICKVLLMKFGPYEQWEQPHAPTNNMKDYEICLEEIARYLSAEFGRSITAGHGAVKQQIEYAIQQPVAAGKMQNELSKIIILMKAAALETGFISSVWPKQKVNDQMLP